MSNEIKDFFKTYSDFVTKVTSDPSLDLDAVSYTHLTLPTNREV